MRMISTCVGFDSIHCHIQNVTSNTMALITVRHTIIRVRRDIRESSFTAETKKGCAVIRAKDTSGKKHTNQPGTRNDVGRTVFVDSHSFLPKECLATSLLSCEKFARWEAIYIFGIYTCLRRCRKAIDVSQRNGPVTSPFRCFQICKCARELSTKSKTPSSNAFRALFQPPD